MKHAFLTQSLNKYVIGRASDIYLKSENDIVYTTYKKKGVISRFLRGEPIAFLPDIRMSNIKYDALKFSSINVRLDLIEGTN